jgi:CSLREA domain-containing protein
MRRTRFATLAVAGALSMLLVAPAGATVISVDTASDSDPPTGDGFCSLREAIIAANTNLSQDLCFGGQPPPVVDTIEFSTGSGPVAVAAPLPDLTEAVIIDGAAGTGTAPRVELNGTSAGANADGLRIAANNSTVRNMVINRFGGHGIEVVSGNTATLVGNYVGLDTTGVNDLGNGGDGIHIGAGINHTVGGTAGVTPDGACTGDCNLIGGNTGNGVLSASNGTAIRGNFVGTNAAGTTGVPNGEDGLHVTGPNHTVGGTSDMHRNVISGNAGDGVELTSSSDTSTVGGNYIGTSTTGSAGLGNSGAGIRIVNSPSNTIGLSGFGPRNVISDNDTGGILITGSSADENVVAGNYVGTDATGTVDLGNQFVGVRTENASEITIGGDDIQERNVISGNTRGVQVTGAQSSDNVVSGNFIGTDLTGFTALGNNFIGLAVEGTNNRIGGTSGVTVGGACTGECNLVSGNENGIDIGNAATNVPTSGTTVLGNYVGTNVVGTAPLGNSFGGVAIDQPTTGTTVGGTTPQARNVIAGNPGTGVLIVQGTSGNAVLGNRIGVGSTGGAVGTANIGVSISNASQAPTGNTIGGDTAAAENEISNNTDAAIQIIGDGTDGNVVARNRGTNNARFLDVAPAIGPGTDAAIGANGGAQPPEVEGAGATAAKGTAPPGATVRLFWTPDAAGAEVTGLAGFAGSATADGSGNWVVTYENAPAAGETVAATQTTAFGTSELSTARAPDGVPPDTAFTSGPADGSATGDNTPTFGFESEADATFECRLDDGGFAACPNPHTLEALSDGEHTLRVRAVDTNLNPDPVPAARTFTVDASVPDTQITAAPPALSRSATARTEFSSTEPGSRFECRLDGSEFAACLSPDTRPVTGGDHVIEVRAIDGVGNADPSPASAAFRIDRTRPTTSRFSLRRRAVRVGRRGNAFRFRLTEAARAVIRIDQRRGRRFARRGSLTRRSARAGQNSVAFRGRIGRRALRPGRYRASLVATDAAGNASRVRRITFRVVR